MTLSEAAKNNIVPALMGGAIGTAAGAAGRAIAKSPAGQAISDRIGRALGRGGRQALDDVTEQSGHPRVRSARRLDQNDGGVSLRERRAWFADEESPLTPLQGAMQNLGIPRKQWNRFVQGDWVVFERQTLGGDPIIALAQRDPSRLRSGILSINDRGSGTAVRDFANWRGDTRNLAKTLQVDEYELFGAQIINSDINNMLARLKFVDDTIQLPNDPELSILAGENLQIKRKVFPRSN